MNAILLLVASTAAGQQPCPPRFVPAIVEPARPANFYMNLYGARPYQYPQQFDDRPDLLPILRYISDQNQQILMALLARRASTSAYAVPGQMPAEPPCRQFGPQPSGPEPGQLPAQPRYGPPQQQLPYPQPCQPSPQPYATPGYDGYVQPGPAARLQPPVGYQRYTVR